MLPDSCCVFLYVRVVLMVRVYVKKRVNGYSEESLHQAIQDAQDGMSQSKASSKYGVPQRTLSDKLSEITPS